MLHSFTPFTRIQSLHSHEWWPLRAYHKCNHINNSEVVYIGLEAQQRYFSYRAMLAPGLRRCQSAEQSKRHCWDSPLSIFGEIQEFGHCTKQSGSQGKTSWVDSACADCPGFLIRGAAGAHIPASSQERQIVPCMAPSPFDWICCTQIDNHPCSNGTNSTTFCAQGDAHQEFHQQIFRTF